MSTKIFNGYRISDCAHTAHLFQFVTDLRAALLPVYRAAYAALVAELAVSAADGGWLDIPDDWGLFGDGLWSPLAYADMAATKAHQEIRRTGRRAPAFDLQCEVGMVPDPADPRTAYALLYTERDDYREVFEAQPGVRPWPYWNNVDRPDDVTEAEWDERREVWDRVLGDEAPARRGLCWEMIGDHHQFLVTDVAEEIAAVLPRLTEVRARRLAGQRITDWLPEQGYAVLRERVWALVPEIVPTLRQWTVDELRRLPDPDPAVTTRRRPR